MHRICFAAALAMVFAGPAFAHNHANEAATAQPAAAPAQASVASPADAKPAVAAEAEQVCKLERQLGSNRAKRVCRSKAEMEADRAAAQDSLRREQR